MQDVYNARFLLQIFIFIREGYTVVLFRSAASMRFIVGVALVCLLCVKAGPTQMSITFSPLHHGGQTLCSADPPAISQGATSAADCANQCVDQLRDGCVGFNYKTSAPACAMFNETASNHASVFGCILYQVLYKHF